MARRRKLAVGETINTTTKATRKKRPAGEGSEARKRKSDGRYECRILIDGKRKFFYGKTALEASLAMRAHVNSPEARAVAKIDEKTVGGVLDVFLALKKATKRDRTYRSYLSVVEQHIKPGIGTVRVAKFTSAHVITLLAGMQTKYDEIKAKKPKAIGPGARTQSLARVIIGQAFKKTHPGIVADVPDPYVKDDDEDDAPERFRAWTAEEARKFLDHVDATNDAYRIFYRVALTTGLRKGEILALTPNVVDTKNGTLKVTGTWNERTLRIGPPKTKKSRRRIDLSDRTRAALRSHILASGARGDDRLFTFDVRNLSKAADKAMKAAKVPRLTIHELRHSFASIALANRANAKIVSEALGHRSVAITLDVYAHFLPSEHRAAMEGVDAAIG